MWMPEHQLRESIEAMYAAFNRRDIDAVLARLSPDVVWANGMEGGHVHGADEVGAYWTRQFAVVQSHVHPKAIRRADDGRVVVEVDQVVRSTEDGSLLSEGGVVHLLTFEGDRVTRFDIVP